MPLPHASSPQSKLSPDAHLFFAGGNLILRFSNQIQPS